MYFYVYKVFYILKVTIVLFEIQYYCYVITKKKAKDLIHTYSSSVLRINWRLEPLEPGLVKLKWCLLDVRKLSKRLCQDCRNPQGSALFHSHRCRCWKNRCNYSDCRDQKKRDLIPRPHPDILACWLANNRSPDNNNINIRPGSLSACKPTD